MNRVRRWLSGGFNYAADTTLYNGHRHAAGTQAAHIISIDTEADTYTVRFGKNGTDLAVGQLQLETVWNPHKNEMSRTGFESHVSGWGAGTSSP